MIASSEILSALAIFVSSFSHVTTILNEVYITLRSKLSTQHQHYEQISTLPHPDLAFQIVPQVLSSIISGDLIKAFARDSAGCHTLIVVVLWTKAHALLPRSPIVL